MTSPRAYQRMTEARIEMRIFNSLSRALRDAINNAEGSVRASVILDTLLRGVPESKIIETISKRSPKP